MGKDKGGGGTWSLDWGRIELERGVIHCVLALAVEELGLLGLSPNPALQSRSHERNHPCCRHSKRLPLCNLAW